jgi:hypothetical protein
VNNPTVTATYSDWIGAQVVAIAKNAVQSNGEIGNVWFASNSTQFYSATVNSAVDAANIAAKVRLLSSSFSPVLTMRCRTVWNLLSRNEPLHVHVED